MKRIHSACTLQTLHFILDQNLPVDEAKAKVDVEVQSYKDNAGTTTKILEKTNLPDGSVMIKVKKKVSGYNVGNYFDD